MSLGKVKSKQMLFLFMRFDDVDWIAVVSVNVDEVTDDLLNLSLIPAFYKNHLIVDQIRSGGRRSGYVCADTANSQIKEPRPRRIANQDV